jgi:hypothetical protein
LAPKSFGALKKCDKRERVGEGERRELAEIKYQGNQGQLKREREREREAIVGIVKVVGNEKMKRRKEMKKNKNG